MESEAVGGEVVYKSAQTWLQDCFLRVSYSINSTQHSYRSKTNSMLTALIHFGGVD